jgi:hypothetical protein
LPLRLRLRASKRDVNVTQAVVERYHEGKDWTEEKILPFSY